MSNTADPTLILETGYSFFKARVLLSAVEIGVFTELGEERRTLAELESALGLHRRASRDFLDALVALGLLKREGDGGGAYYANTPDTAMFLDSRKTTYIGGLLKLASDRVYRVWANLTEGLRTGQPQNEIKQTGKTLFDALYADAQGLEVFTRAMAGLSMGACMVFAEKFDFTKYQTLVDVGGSTGLLSISVARRHPHIRATSADLAAVEPIAEKSIAAANLAGRVKTAVIDFFAEPIPKADVVTMGHVLHLWDLPQKMRLIRAAYDALPAGGAFIAIENIIDDARRENAPGLLMSLHMLLETNGGFDYSGADFGRWCREVGFSKIEMMHLAGPWSAAIAIK